MLIVSEPFLAQESQRVDFPLRLRLPIAGKAVPAGGTGAKLHFMNTNSLLTLLLFFVLQGLIYIACVVKLYHLDLDAPDLLRKQSYGVTLRNAERRTLPCGRDADPDREVLRH